MKLERLHIVFAGGGTLGHLLPGIVVARELKRQDRRLRITFVTGPSQRDRDVAEANGFEHASLPCCSSPRSAWETVKFFRENLAGYQAASRVLRDRQVHLVVGLGGYTSVAAGKAAVSQAVPLVLLEQNALPGRANRWLAPGASLVCVAFDEARAHLKTPAPIRWTGNPVRPAGNVEMANIAGGGRSDHARRLVVLGGSGGSRELNANVPRAIYKAGGAQGWRIVHQTGSSDAAGVRRLYDKLGIDAEVTGFVDEVPALLDDSDLAISRAGGTTLAELAVAGVPAILVPWHGATDGHQYLNASSYAAGGAAVVVEGSAEGDRLDNRLAVQLERLMADARQRATMSVAMADRGRADAAWQVASMVRDLLRGQRRKAG